MFESNFPVDKVTSSYAVYWNTFKRIVLDASPTEKRFLFHIPQKLLQSGCLTFTERRLLFLVCSAY
ncbi:MAG: hypothetical protein CM15mP14_4530 [Rhodospirillaceae bacterium]|nr:MAG: hypothetical protein CM15mP14_4530 [Rhodospirillaceae bacterium]